MQRPLRMRRRSRKSGFGRIIAHVLLTAATPWVVAGGPVFGQPSGTFAGPAVKYSNLIFTVGNLERSVAFYRDQLGLKLLSMSRRPSGDKIVNPYVAKVSGSPPEVVFASAILKLPGAGFNLLLTEFGDVDRNPRRPDVRESGNAALILSVRDLDRALQELKNARVRMATERDVPLELEDHSRAVAVLDPDGFLIELLQPSSRSEVPDSGKVLAARVRLTVNQLEKSREFYRKTLGFKLSAASRFSTDNSLETLWGAAMGVSRKSTGGLPGMESSHEFVEFKPRATAGRVKHLRDPGISAFSVGVGDVDRLLSAMRASGARVISTGAEPAVSPNGGRNVFVQDLDGFFWELEGAQGR